MDTHAHCERAAPPEDVSTAALHSPCLFKCDAAVQGHGMAVDWWAFGVFLYEMMAGFPPFYDEDVTNTYKKILSGRFGFPAHFSVNARDLIRKLLQVVSVQPTVSMHALSHVPKGYYFPLRLFSWWTTYATLDTASALQADLSKRYGCLAGGANDIKNHPWFKGVDWIKVAKREETPPIRWDTQNNNERRLTHIC